jgi:hypothetical protein
VEYGRAKSLLSDLNTRKSLVTLLASELEYSTSVPELVSRADKIEKLIKRMVDSGFAAETAVQDAFQRMGRIKGLLDVRNAIRSAVELCCISDMEAAMARREALVALYGDELFSVEAAAVASLRRLITVEKYLYIGFEDRDPTLPRLPRFIRSHLDVIKSPPTAADAAIARDKLQLLVPDCDDLGAYTRVFKWIVSVASWKYQRESEDATPLATSAPIDASVNFRSGSKSVTAATSARGYATSEYTATTKKTSATSGGRAGIYYYLFAYFC